MYNIGDLFVYGVNGACKIVDIKEEKFGSGEKTYYILAPYSDLKETIFVPVDNEMLVSRMKKILTPEEINSLIKTIPSAESIWEENVNLRREKFREIISKANRTELIALLKTLYERRKALKLIGKNLSTYDERFLRQAQNIIHSEIALVLQIPQDEVAPYIERAINAA